MKLVDLVDRFLREHVWQPFLLCFGVIFVCASIIGGFAMSDYLEAQEALAREKTLQSLPADQAARLIAYERCQDESTGELQEVACNDIFQRRSSVFDQ